MNSIYVYRRKISILALASGKIHLELEDLRPIHMYPTYLKQYFSSFLSINRVRFLPMYFASFSKNVLVSTERFQEGRSELVSLLDAINLQICNMRYVVSFLLQAQPRPHSMPQLGLSLLPKPAAIAAPDFRLQTPVEYHQIPFFYFLTCFCEWSHFSESSLQLGRKRKKKDSEGIEITSQLQLSS